MPTFSYKGYDFEVDHTPTEGEFSQMSAYVDTLPPKQQTQSLVDQIPGIGQVGNQKPAPEASLLDKATGVGEAGLSTATGLIGGTLAGTVGGIQGVIDSIGDGTFGTQIGVAKAGDKFHEQAALATYEPRTQTGKDYASKVGEFISQQAPALVGIAPQLAGLSALSKFKKVNNSLKPQELSSAAKTAMEFEAKKAAEQPKAMPKVQEELDLGQPNQYGHRPSEFTVDENGIPIRRDASLEAQETVRQGDLFSRDNQATELRNDVLNNAEAGTEGIPGSRDYLRKQEEELAYQQKAKQESLFPEESVVEPSQRSVEMDNPTRPSPNRGKFGQGGAIDPDVFLKDFPEFVSSVIKDTAGKLKVLYHGTSADQIFDNFKANKRGIFLTDDPSVASMYARDNDAKGPKYDSSTGKYVNKNVADRVIPVYADIKNPYKLSEKEAHDFKYTSNYAKMQRDLTARVKAQGHDGIIYTDGAIVAFDPKQIVSATSPKVGQTKFGKSQRGSIGFFGKDPFEKFAENLRKEVPNVSDEAIKYAWDKQQATATPEIAKQKQSTAQGQAYQQITGLDPKVTGEVWTPEKAVEIFQTTPDLEGRGLIKEQLMSSGRLQRDLFNHPAVTWVYNLTTAAVEQGRLRARQVIDDASSGVIPKIRSHTMFGGAKEMRELLKWRFENEGMGVTLPDTFSAKAKQINDLLNKGDEKLLAKMNEVLAKDGKKPVQAIDNHMVHYWSGPYRAYVYVKTQAGGSKLGFFVSEKSMKDAQKAMDWIKKNVPNIDLEKTKSVEFVKSDIRNRTSMFDHLLDLSNEKDPIVLEALQSFKDRIEAAQSKHLSEHNRQKYRAGVQGFSGNKPWFDEARNYSDAMDSIRTKYDAGYQWVAAQEIKQQMAPILEAQKEGKISIGKALVAGQKYVDHALGKNADMSVVTRFADYLEDMSPKIAGPARTAMTDLQHVASRITLPFLLALKGTQAVQSVLQVPMATIPRMLELRRSWDGSYANMGTALAHGSIDGLFQLSNTLTGGKFEALTRSLLQGAGKDLSEMSLQIHKFMNENDVSRMSLADTGASREGGLLKTASNYASDALLNAPMNLFEGPTRTWAFSTYARQAIKDGHPVDVALKIAKEQMDTMVNYNPEASAMGLSNLGVIGQEAKGLHTFMINYYSQLYRYIDIAKQQKNPEPLLAYLGLTFAAGGAVGFIGADLADWLLDGVKSAMSGSKYDTPELQKLNVRQWLMTNTPDAVSVGPLSASTGLGLYGSFTTKVVDPERGFLENTFPKTMASIQIAKGIANSPKLFNENLSDKDRGTIIENMAPKYLTQSIRNKYQNKDGVVYDPNADRAGLPMYKRTEAEQKISERGFGIRSLPEVMTQEDSLQVSKGQKRIDESQKKQLTKLDSLLIAGWKSGDNITQFQKQAIGKQLGNVISTWKVNPDVINTRLESLALHYGIPQDSLRKMLDMKDVNFSNVDKFEDLNDARNRQIQRQDKYGR